MSAVISIGTNYEGKQLTFIEKSAEELKLGSACLDWNKYPVQLLEGERRTMANMPLVISVIAGECRLPSAMIGLRSDKIASSAIERIDDYYRNLMKKYKKCLVAIEDNDRKVIDDLKKRNWVYTYNNAFGLTFYLLEMMKAPLKSSEGLAREGSFFRIRWLYDIERNEETRLANARFEIINTVFPRLQDLKQMKEKSNSTRMDFLLEIKQLTAIYQAMFPNEPHDYISDALKFLDELPKDCQAALTKKM